MAWACCISSRPDRARGRLRRGQPGDL
ncbi:hypothetical protein [Micromonospora sp. DT31]